MPHVTHATKATPCHKAHSLPLVCQCRQLLFQLPLICSKALDALVDLIHSHLVSIMHLLVGDVADVCIVRVSSVFLLWE